MIQVIGNRLYQWDSNRQVLLTGDDASASQVHFTDICSGDNALVVEVKDINGQKIADIPNSLLMSGHDIKVYSWNDDHTIHGRAFPVTRRKRPSDYVYSPSDVVSMEKLTQRIDDLEKKLEELEVAGGPSDYTMLENKPSINEVILDGDKSFEELGINEIESESIDKMFEESLEESINI